MSRPAPDGGGAGADLDTKIEGTPADAYAISSWLESSLGAGTEDLATSVFRQRSVARSDWEGKAGSAFDDRATTLGKSADEISGQVKTVARKIDTLAGKLESAQKRMESICATAAGAGLTVSGTVIHHPGPAPAEAGPAPGPGADSSAVDSWNAANDAVSAYNKKIDAWNTAVSDADDTRSSLDEELKAHEEEIAELRRSFVHITGDFLQETTTAALELKHGSILAKQSQWLKELAEQQRGHAQYLVDKDGKVLDPKKFYELQDAARDADYGSSKLASEVKTGAELPKGVSNSLLVIGAAATAYNTYDEIKHGENPTEAVVANGVGFGASVLAGTEVGGTVGTFIGGPVGTVVGAGVGALTGVVVGAFTTGAITSAWDHAGEGIGAIGEGIKGGVDDVENTLVGTGEAIGHGASKAWHAVFG